MWDIDQGAGQAHVGVPGPNCTLTAGWISLC